MRSRRRLIVTLPGDAYRLLVRLAEREERAVDQQASFLLRRALAAAGTECRDLLGEADRDAG